ncbi:MAG: phosphoribosylaminoimidazolesuccinocarboxamide synthase [Candidatus Komeilibacteria bacterium]|nr:phosphoribosylaminoimidazolesuccinocarboxamide synthase [Candidatus Komeilibacteria bacterium]
MDKAIIEKNIYNVITETNFKGLGEKKVGKVRDSYTTDDKIILITTDRQSAFDRILASIPFKGQVLNQTSAWWFEHTKDIIPNFLLDVPDPNVVVGKKCTVFPMEIIVRGYLTGSTDTSVWVNYEKGVRDFCGNKLGEGMVKNQKFGTPIVTPSTKFEKHDRNLSKNEILAEHFATVAEFDYISAKALELFAFGQKTAASHGLILVDTKYEFGKDENGTITLIDEIHTPDSSRYWLRETYSQRISEGKEPDNIDKEFLRLWFKDHCDPYHDEVLPEAPRELIVELSSRYIKLYEMITGQTFTFEDKPILKRIEENLKKRGYLV